jgi:peptidoglycan hydrolase-like protein with peptidoglycan-binding domain
MEANLPQLTLNSKGEAVRIVQQLLISYGNLSGADFNAEFGQSTLAAVKQFQTDILGSSEADGIVGKKTWNALGSWTSNFCNQISA